MAYSLKDEQKALRGYIKKCNSTEDENYIRKIANEVKASHNPYLICDFMAGVPKARTKDIMQMFEDEMVRIGDIVHSYEFMFLMTDMAVQTFDKKRFESLIKESGNPKLMMYCLGFVPEIDTESMLEALYDTKNAKYINELSISEDYEYLHVQDRPEYAIKLQEAKEFDYFPQSLAEYKNKDGKVELPDLISSVIKSDSETVVQKRKKAYQINELANYLAYLGEYHAEEYSPEFLKTSIELLQNAELVAGDQEPLHLYEFAASVETRDKSSIIRRVIDLEDDKYVHYCLEYVPNVPENLKTQMEKSLEHNLKGKGNQAPSSDDIVIG